MRLKDEVAWRTEVQRIKYRLNSGAFCQTVEWSLCSRGVHRFPSTSHFHGLLVRGEKQCFGNRELLGWEFERTIFPRCKWSKQPHSASRKMVKGSYR